MKAISYNSTNGNTPPVSFKEALIQGLAPDKGLFMPSRFPAVSQRDITAMKGMEYWEIAFFIAKKFLQGEVPEEELGQICKEAYDFAVPLERAFGKTYVMRLDQGPTASFKDFAARMMSRLMQFFLKQGRESLTILTATSGDTGSAVANAFFGLKNIKMVVLFPKNEVSGRQRKQMTTLGKNVTAIAVDGKFDDCQALVKQAFSDPALKGLNLSSANSINFGRLLPQTVYYFYAYAKLFEKPGEKALFSVPSGNFGDLCGGLIAMRMGLPVEKFVAATNENDEFPKFLKTGKYEKLVPSKECLSNAMNVGHPSNLARLVALYGGQMDETGAIKKMPDMKKMRADISAVSVSNAQTKEAIEGAYSKYGTLLEPHGAVGWFALQQAPKEARKGLCICLETAHPAKFPEIIKETLGVEPELPKSLLGLEGKKEQFEEMPNGYDKFKKFLLKKITVT